MVEGGEPAYLASRLAVRVFSPRVTEALRKIMQKLVLVETEAEKIFRARVHPGVRRESTWKISRAAVKATRITTVDQPTTFWNRLLT